MYYKWLHKAKVNQTILLLLFVHLAGQVVWVTIHILGITIHEQCINVSANTPSDTKFAECFILQNVSAHLSRDERCNKLFTLQYWKAKTHTTVTLRVANE